MKTQEKFKKNKSSLISFGIHAAILLASLVPIASRMHEDIVFEEEPNYEVEIEFAEFASAGDEGMRAESPVRDTEVKAVVQEQDKEPAKMEAEEISEVTESTPEAEPIESDITTEETETDVLAAEDNISGDAEETTSPGGSDGTLHDGNNDGNAAEGDGDGESGLDGDGVITRRVIHREDITKAAEYSGTIAIDLCIDRRGYVVSVAKNAERTTITDSDIIRKALDIAARYRFEANYSAARRDCGTLTFIFDIEKDEEGVYVTVE